MSLLDKMLDDLASSLNLEVGDMCVVHQAALQMLGVDNNVFPRAADVVLKERDFLKFHASPFASYHEFKVGNTPYRIWRARGPLKKVYKEAEPLKACPVRCPSPETILRLLPSSPDFPYLREQYAGLAVILYFDRMTDEELGEFFRYVRI